MGGFGLIDELFDAIEDMRTRLDKAYLERNLYVALIARFAFEKGYKVGLAIDNNSDVGKQWRNVVLIDLPVVGQISSHFHDTELLLFNWLPAYDGVWDGHTNQEKYDRLTRCITCIKGNNEPQK
jgi:hypothetical protein